MRVAKFWTVLLLVAVAAGAGASSWDFRHTVRPGSGIGPIGLGWTPHQVRVAMNKLHCPSLLTTKAGIPRPWKDTGANAWVEAYTADPMGHGRYATIFKVFYQDHKVVQLAVSSSIYQTNRGARVSMTSGEFQDRHPTLRRLPVTASWGGRVRPYDSPRLGLAVTYVVFGTGNEAISGQEILVHNPESPLLIESRRHEGGIHRTDLDEFKAQLPPSPGG